MKHKRRNILVTLSPGVAITFSCDNLLLQMIPRSERGVAQDFIKTSIIALHQTLFPHMRLTSQEYLQDLCEKYETKPASVIATAVAWHAGKHQ